MLQENLGIHVFVIYGTLARPVSHLDADYFRTISDVHGMATGALHHRTQHIGGDPRGSGRRLGLKMCATVICSKQVVVLSVQAHRDL